MTVFSISLVCTLLPLLCAAVGPVVQTKEGKLEGITATGVEGHQVDQFLGVPYAAPPIGENRWRPPQPMKPFDYRKATERGPICHQWDSSPGHFAGQEDCLYLNVYRPAGIAADAKLPVFVWLYGGGFTFGDGNQWGFYDGTNVAERYGHIVVTLNYRLYALGFLALPELAEENNGTSGNAGFQDQTAALQWVQRNIAAFGGDPTRVTLTGESAGAMSVGCHMISPASKGLFHTAIMESGNLRTSYEWFPKLAEAYKFGDGFATHLGCPPGKDRLACLRKLPEANVTIPFSNWVSDFFQEFLINDWGLPLPLPKDLPQIASPVYPFGPFGPVIDGSPDGIPDDPQKLLDQGKFHKVPLVIGTNKDGGSWIGVVTPLAYGALPFLDDDIDQMARWLLQNKTDQYRFMQLYDYKQKGSFWRTRINYGRVWRDSFFQCSTRDIAQAVSRHGVEVYHYVFDFEQFGFLDKTFHIGASHVFEIPFVFRTHITDLPTFLNPLHIPDWWRMADLVSCTWASFVKCQKPKCSSDPPPNCDSTYKAMPEWIPFSEPDNRNYLRLNLKPMMFPILKVAPIDENFAGDDKCDFWGGVQYKWHNPHDFWRPKQDTKTLIV